VRRHWGADTKQAAPSPSGWQLCVARHRGWGAWSRTRTANPRPSLACSCCRQPVL
jgi:hypothetical protein